MERRRVVGGKAQIRSLGRECPEQDRVGQTPVVEQVAADEEGHEGAPAMHHEHEREDPNESPTLAGELGQALTYTPERSPTGTVDRIPGGHAPRIRCLPVSMDPIALLTSAVSATMVSVLLFVLPGAALGPLVLPIAPTPWPGSVALRASVYWWSSPGAPSSPGSGAWMSRRSSSSPWPSPSSASLCAGRPGGPRLRPAPARLVGRGPGGDCPGLRPRAHPVIPGRQPAISCHGAPQPGTTSIWPRRPRTSAHSRLSCRNGAPCARSPRTICQ